MPKVHLDILIRGTDASRGMMTGFRQGVRAAGRDTAGLKGHLDKLDRSLGGLNRNLDRLGSRWQNLAASGERIGRGMTIAGGASAAAIGLIARATVQASSDLAESNNKAGEVFGDAVGKVRAMAEEAASAMGQSRAQALEAAASFGNLFLSIGMTQGVAADMSMNLVQLAADLASFNNISIDDALVRLRSGLVGEAEPMRRLGVLLSEERVALKAVEMGLVTNKNAVTEQAKVQARYALILEQTKTAQGDFGRTSDQLANRQRILAAQFENTKAALGDALTPAINAALDDLMPLIDAFAKWAKENPGQVAGIMKWAAAITAANLVIGPLLSNSRNLLTTWQLLGTAGKRLAGLKIGGLVAGGSAARIGAGAAAAGLPAAYRAGEGVLPPHLAKRASKAILDDMATGRPVVGEAAGDAAGKAMGDAAGKALAVTAPTLGARIAAGFAAAKGMLASAGVAIAAVIAAYLVDRTWKEFKKWQDAQKDEEKNALAAAAEGTAAGKGIGGTLIPGRIGRESIDPEEARKRGWVPVGTVGEGQDENNPGQWYIPAGAMPLTPEEQAKMLRARTRGPSADGGPPFRVGEKPTAREGVRIFARFIAEGEERIDPQLAKLQADRDKAAFFAAHPEFGAAPGGDAGGAVGSAAGGKGLPDPKEEKQYQDWLRGLQQQVDLLDAQGKSAAEVGWAQENLAKGYDAYAARLEASGQHLEAVDAQIAAMRLRKTQRDAWLKENAEGVQAAWDAKLKGLEQAVEWAEAAAVDPNAPAITAAKLQLIEGLKAYAGALFLAGKTEESTAAQIRAMRIEAELRKQGIDTRPRETWQQIGFGRVRSFVSSEGRRRREVDTTPRPGSFEYDVARAHRLDVISPSRDATVAAQTAGGGAGQAEVKQVNVYIGGEKIDERVRGEVLESLRGTARQ